ncbi:unnamed protein product, partial [Urochloa humidicola]
YPLASERITEAVAEVPHRAAGRGDRNRTGFSLREREREREMAALRSGLAMLRRGSSGSSAVAFMGGRALEVNQVFRHAPPPLYPAAIRDLGCRHCSTGAREPADKAESGLRMLWKQARNRVKNANLEERARVLFVYTLFVVGTPSLLAVKAVRDVCGH